MILAHIARAFHCAFQAKNQHHHKVLGMLLCDFQSSRSLSLGRCTEQQNRGRHVELADLRRGRIAPASQRMELQSKSLEYDDDNVRSLEEEIRFSLSRNVSPLVNDLVKGVVMVVGVSGGCDSVGLLHGLVRGLSSDAKDSEDPSLFLQLKD